MVPKRLPGVYGDTQVAHQALTAASRADTAWTSPVPKLREVSQNFMLTETRCWDPHHWIHQDIEKTSNGFRFFPGTSRQIPVYKPYLLHLHCICSHSSAWDTKVTTNSKHYVSALNHSAMEPVPFCWLQNERFLSTDYRLTTEFSVSFKNAYLVLFVKKQKK